MFKDKDKNMIDTEFIKIRDEFSKELKRVNLKANIAGWNFSINSTNENLKELEKTLEFWLILQILQRA